MKKFSVIAIGVFVLLTTVVTGATFTGNAVLEDVTANSSSYFNFTSMTVMENGHVQMDNVSGQLTFTATSNASIYYLGYWAESHQDFLDEWFRNPYVNYTSFGGQSYVNGGTITTTGLDLIAIYLGDTDQYGALYINSSNLDVNATLYWQFNNASGNSSFRVGLECGQHGIIDTCLAQMNPSCDWLDQQGFCDLDDFQDIPPAECGILPEQACANVSDTVCLWDADIGSFGKCTPQADFVPGAGFNCTSILNQSFCENQPYTEGTGLCSWHPNNNTCMINKSRSFEELTDPPTFSCSSGDYVSNQTACLDLAETWFMPCGWDNTTDKCTDLFFDGSEFEHFDDISNENSCKLVGGTWQTETTYNPILNEFTSESWCEFGIKVLDFDAIGSGGVDLTVISLVDCSHECFACEYQSNGSAWADQDAANNACTGSQAGCTMRNDTNAFNGFGWCEPIGGFTGASCESFCGDCNLHQDAESACTNSPADCKWDNVTSHCIDQGQKGCLQDCTQCPDTNSCGASPANGGCTWDSDGFFCKPENGVFEICYDGIDNDGNDKTDCADSKCNSDAFCAGSSFDTSNCFQYDPFTYGAEDAAQGNCTAVAACSWLTDDTGFNYCGPVSEQCFLNFSLQSDQAACEATGGGDVCVYETDTFCVFNQTQMSSCFSQGNEGDCNTAPGCAWNSDQSFCDGIHFVRCEDNSTAQASQGACEAIGCYWQGDDIGGDFEGHFFESCVSPCFQNHMAEDTCLGNATTLAAGSCVWQAGLCAPANFIGGCPDDDGDIASCQANSNCVWETQPFGPLKALNGSTSPEDFHQPGTQWIAFGLQKPIEGTGVSTYNLSSASSYLYMIQSNESAQTFDQNVSYLYCEGTRLMQYNYTNASCEAGVCDQYGTSVCDSSTVHYFLNTTTGELEALWEVSTDQLNLDGTLGNTIVSTTSQVATVAIDGNLGEHANESATAGDGTNATRVLTAPGFCDDQFQQQFFSDLESGPPVILAIDPPGDVSSEFVDINGMGVLKTENAYIYGIQLADLSGSSYCKNQPLSSGGTGQGENTSRYYIYLDTDGTETGGCTADDDTSLAGFEYLFKLVSQIDQTGDVTVTTLTQQCSSGSWVASNVPFKTDRQVACGEIGIAMFGIDKDTFVAKSNVNTEEGWRTYATAADAGGSTTNVNDTVGPNTADFKGIDAELVDCANPEDRDDPQCTKFKQFGFFPGEFGPACVDSVDNDGDGLTDCDDLDCAYDPFFCDGSFSSAEDDSSSPSFVSTKINNKVPTQLSFIFNTNEPANGSVLFYNQNSSCQNINTTILDGGLLDDESLTDYRPHHVADINGLSANTTYFYKFQSCDVAGNCAISRCSNVTTSTGHSNVTFKLDIPDGWVIHMPQLNLTNYSGQYALKASTEHLSDLNITISQPDNSSQITFSGLDIFEKQTLNVSEFVNADDYVGFDANQYQNLKQKTGVEEVTVVIPEAGDVIQHCDDSGENCQTVTDNLDCVEGTTTTTCVVPDAVGLGFSSYLASTSPSSSSSGGGGGGGSSGGGGGGGAAVIPKGVTYSRFYTELPVGTTSFAIPNEKIALRNIDIDMKAIAQNADFAITTLNTAPDEGGSLDAEVYEFIDISVQIPSSAIDDVVLTFSVDRTWLSERGAAVADVILYRYSTGAWQSLPTEFVSSDSLNHVFEARSPGFSTFAIGVEVEEEVEVVDVPSAPPEIAEEEPEPEPPEPIPDEPARFPFEIFIGIALLIIAIVVFAIFHGRKKD